MEKKILLFSGGFDSTLQEYLIKPDVLLYVDMKTTYSEREKEFLKTLSPYYTDRLVIKELPLGEYERANMYLPYRNLILGTIAMQYGQHVFFGFNHCDDAPDKDNTFLYLINRMFRHLNINAIPDMGWENKHFSFSAPFNNLSKTQMVKLCLEKGMPVEQIQNIRTCYSGVSHKGCGVCSPCRSKAVALLNNGIFTQDAFDEPITEKLFQDTLDAVKNGQIDYKDKYCSELRQAINNLRKYNASTRK